MTNSTPLRRSRDERWIAGVCGGLAKWTGMSPGAVRAIFIVLSIVPGSIVGGLIVYLILWLAVPEESAPPTPGTPATPSTPPAAAEPGEWRKVPGEHD